jgi:hypothetical protein
MAAPRVSSHGLDAPTESDVLASLGRFVGSDKALVAWTEACTASGLSAGSIHLPESLEAPLTQLKARGGYEAVAASSLLVRIRTYKLLSSTPALA